MSGEEVFDPRRMLKVLRSMIPDCKRYLVPSKIVPDLFPVLEEDKIREILEKEKHSREEAVQILMEAVLAKKEDGLNLFISALREANVYERFLNPFDTRTDATASNHELTNEYFKFIILCVRGDIIRNITKVELRKILECLYNENIIEDMDVEDIAGMNLQQGVLQLFTTMSSYTPQWPLKFFYALEQVKPELIRKIDPMEEPPYIMVDKEAVAAGFQGTSADTNADDTIPKRPRISEPEVVSGNIQEMALSTQRSSEEVMDFDEDLLLGSDSEAENEFSDEDGEKEDDDTEKGPRPQELKMRSYQYELAGPALTGANTIVCAPTGSGKTRVALYIVQQHLEQASHTADRKVVFLARTVPLVSQQFKIFEKYLPDFRCVLVTGETEDRENLHLMLEDYDILVLTPKILENHLTPDKIPSLSAFSLIIFDECHHTRKGEPYNSVMKNYLQFKKDGEKNLPQIVGLTASIGVEKASTTDKAAESIIEIMANLDVNKISVVKVHTEELELTVPKPDEKLVELVPRGEDDISCAIMTNMKMVEKLLSSQFPARMTDPELADVYSVVKKQPHDHKSQKYGQWAVKISKHATRVHIPEYPDKVHSAGLIENRRLFSQNMQLLAETLMAYNEALDVHELTRPVDVLEHLKKKLQPRHPPNSPQRTQVETRLCDLFASLEKKLKRGAMAKNPNLSKLSDAITEKLENQWESSRVMVFVRTRATCEALCSWLNSDNVSLELQQLKASPFTGAGAHQDQGGMTQHEQEGVIEKFQAGDVKLIVCTTVGQEGMDIPDCNLVIRYNHVGNEVTTVQTRGRSRKAGGLSILLAMPPVIRKERINKQLVKIMNQAIVKVNEMRKREVENQVVKAQKQAMDKDEMKKKASMRSKGERVKQGSFALECIRCRKVRVLGSQLRTINSSHHVVIGNDLLDNEEVRIRFREKPKNVDNVQFTGEIICNKCPVTRPNCLGTTLRSQEVQYLTLKAESWVVLGRNNVVEKSGKWKWKDIGYHIPELSLRDVSEHLGQPQDDSEEEGAAGGMAD